MCGFNELNKEFSSAPCDITPLFLFQACELSDVDKVTTQTHFLKVSEA